MKNSVSVVIPAKNEEKALKNLISGVVALDGILEVIVVDDGSMDNTVKVSEDAGAKVISHPYSKGNGAAIKTGARSAKGDIIVFMDGDGQHTPSDIPRLLKKLRQGYDMVVGAREKGCHASIGRGMANNFYNRLASYMTAQKVEDLTSGFRIVKRNLFLEFLTLLPNGFSYPTTSTMAFFRAGYSVGYMSIKVSTRIGRSHIKPLHDGIRFLIIIFKIGTLYSPLKIFVPIALLVFLVGAGYYGYTYFSFGRFTNMSALMLTTSLMVFLVGLVSEQIAQLMYQNLKSGDSTDLDK